jgi:OOP family OmpA-OmpF porin
MATRLRMDLRVAPKVNLKAMLAKVAIGSLALSGVIFFAAFMFTNLGIQNNSVAGEKAAIYPFDVTDNTMRRVNFTVLDQHINSEFEEVRPLISPNGKELFFCRRNHPGNVQKKKDSQDIWVTTLQSEGQWSAPQNLGLTINTSMADALCSVSPDGSEIIFVREEMDQQQPLMKASRSANGWGAPEHLQIEDFYNKSEYIDFFHSYEANVLLMAVMRKDSRGEQDLYVSFPVGKDKWSAPVNLGPVVNSYDADFAPFLAADGRTLYFASYGHKGFGGCDIFQTTRLDDTWQRWSKPKNLGEGINSPREESYFSISNDHEYIYFESYDPRNEVRDIFRANIPDLFKPVLIQENAVANTIE